MNDKALIGLHARARKLMNANAEKVKAELMRDPTEQGVGRAAGTIAHALVQKAVAAGKRVPLSAVSNLIPEVARDLSEAAGRMRAINVQGPQAKDFVGRAALYAGQAYGRKGKTVRQQLIQGQSGTMFPSQTN